LQSCRRTERYPVCLLGEGVRDNGVELADERAGTGSVKTSERLDAGIGITLGVFEHELEPPTAAATLGV
jgi:hypothetical protein